VIAMRPEPLVGATHNIIPIPAPEIGQRTCNQRFAHDRAASGVSHRHESRSFVNDGMSSDEIKRLFGPVGMDAPVTRGNFDDIAAFLGHDRTRGDHVHFRGHRVIVSAERNRASGRLIEVRIGWPKPWPDMDGRKDG
jgi:hypothetical protein